jgi:hypothetical protein
LSKETLKTAGSAAIKDAEKIIMPLLEVRRYRYHAFFTVSRIRMIYSGQVGALDLKQTFPSIPDSDLTLKKSPSQILFCVCITGIEGALNIFVDFDDPDPQHWYLN